MVTNANGISLRLSSVSAFGQTFEYKQGEVTVAFEFQPQGAAMVIVNDSERAVTLNPKDIKVTTDDGSISPCTLHMLSMFGMGAPAMDVTVKPGGRDGYIR